MTNQDPRTRAFTRFAFSPAVQLTQMEMGVRDFCQALERQQPENAALSPVATAFVERTRTAFISTVNEWGWPYVQHRGGPEGFIEVVSNRQLSLPDYDGNRQFITAGNLSQNPQLCLILMDFDRGGRLKIWGRGKMCMDQTMNAPDPLDRPRRIDVEIAAWDFNCSKHIRRSLDCADGVSKHVQGEDIQ